MAQIIWTEPALSDLDAIADYIALEDSEAARQLMQRVFRHVSMLTEHPDGGSKPPELRDWRYQQLVEPPLRIFYLHENGMVFILHVQRSERRLRRSNLSRSKLPKKKRD